MPEKLYSEKAAEFMKKNSMHPESIDLDASLDVYVREMEKGLKEKAMFPMVPTYVHGDICVVTGKKALAVDVGGTNLRLGLVGVDSIGRLRTYGLEKAQLPGLKGPVSAEAFFGALADSIAPYLKSTDMISFSFAHEIKHTPDLDGHVIALSKELTVTGIEGESLGENLKKALAERGAAGAKVIVINDTVGVACSMACRSGEYDSFIGLVMGTGTNTSYIEESENIIKINDAPSSSMFINVESAEFIPPRSLVDCELDAMTDLPGAAPLEKMISGRYVGNLFWLTVKHAAEEGILSDAFKKEFEKHTIADTIAMSEFLNEPNGNGFYSGMCSDDKDRSALYTIADMMIKRGARLIALEIAGIAVKTGKGRDQGKPICVVAEGTTYYTLKGLKAEVEGLLYGWLKAKGIHVKVSRVSNAALKGIGAIGLSYM